MTLDDRHHFAANLKRCKEESGKEWTEIAEDLGYQGKNKERYLLALAAGRNEPRLKTVRAIARYFGVYPWQEMLKEPKS